MGTTWIHVSGSCTIGIDCTKCCDGVERASREFGNCTLNLRVRDRFSNPIDIGGPYANIDLPFSTPYGLNASCHTILAGTTNYSIQQCNDNRIIGFILFISFCDDIVTVVRAEAIRFIG